MAFTARRHLVALFAAALLVGICFMAAAYGEDARYQAVPLRADFSLDPEATLSAIEKTRPAIVFLAYPNNPTGNLFDAAVVEEVIRAAPGLVVVDEAYVDFGGETAIRLGGWPAAPGFGIGRAHVLTPVVVLGSAPIKRVPSTKRELARFHEAVEVAADRVVSFGPPELSEGDAP